METENKIKNSRSPEKESPAEAFINEDRQLESEARKSVSEYLKEQGIEAPPIEFKIFLGPHMTAAEAEDLKDDLEKADIFVPELIGWDKFNYDYLWNEVSFGRLNPEAVREITTERFRGEEFYDRLTHILYGSKKEILLIDLPLSHPLTQEIVDRLKEIDHLPFNFLDKNFDEALEIIGNSYEAFAATQKKREEFLINQLPARLSKLLTEKPELSEKEKINILIFIGTIHTRLPHLLKAKKENISYKFSSKPFVYSFIHELYRRADWDKTIDRAVRARALMEQIFFHSYSAALSNFKLQDRILISRKIIPKFSMSEIEEAFNHYNEKGFPERILGMVEAKGLRVPVNEEELKYFLERK